MDTSMCSHWDEGRPACVSWWSSDPLRFVKHEGLQHIFGIETKPDGSGAVYAVDLDTWRVLRGEGLAVAA